jgi:tetratricopeptide (TPR) repeat protein
MSSNIPQVLARAVDATLRGDHGSALPILTAVYRAVPPEQYPQGLSSYGLCLSRIEHKNRAGAQLCEKAIAAQPYEALHWANLIRLYVGVRNRRKAVEVLERALRQMPGDKVLLGVRDEIGYRQAPYFRFMRRQNPMNRLYSRAVSATKRHARPILITLGGAGYIALLAGVLTYVVR